MRQQISIKRLLAGCGRRIAREHLVMGAMGNISARKGKIFWVKRQGAWFERSRPEDFIAVDVRTGKARASQLPSKEIFLHLGCYKCRPDIGAVVHTHPVMATALASANVDINRKAQRIKKIIGSEVKVLPYYPPGSKRLAYQVETKMKKANAVLLANHGLVTVGKNIQEAYKRTIACEKEAQKFLKSLQQK